MTDVLTKALLLEEVVSDEAVAEALFASVTSGISLVRALTDVGAVTPEVLGRYLARTPAPYLRHVAPLMELVDRLPPGLCERLLAVPVRRDAITGTIDVVVADTNDPHAGAEIGFHLGAPIRLVRAPPSAIEEACATFANADAAMDDSDGANDDERLYDSRPRAPEGRSLTRRSTLKPYGMLEPAPSPSRPPQKRRTSATPPWGTPVHSAPRAVKSEPPRSALGSEIPIPLTRRTFAAVSGGTQRPPPLVDPAESALGEGYPVDAAHFRQIVEVNERSRTSVDPGMLAGALRAGHMPSFIPGEPAMPARSAHADIGGILAALRAAGSRDEILELVLTGARLVAVKVALFVAKRGGYLGWACTPEFGDRGAVQLILVPLERGSVFDEAVRDGVYLGPIRQAQVHAPLLHVMRGASRDVAVVAIRVSGKTAVIIVADELFDTMLATRRLEELARGAGDAFARIVRQRR